MFPLSDFKLECDEANVYCLISASYLDIHQEIDSKAGLKQDFMIRQMT